MDNALAVSVPSPSLASQPQAKRRTRIGDLPERRVSSATDEISSLLSDQSDLGLSSIKSAIKRIVDLIGSALLLVLFAPLFVFIFSAIKLASPGPAIFGHRRLGRNGHWFTCYKFRTMVQNGDAVLEQALAANPALRAEWERDEKLRCDPRVTSIGNFLRRTSLDELPQLFNVLFGQMSLVGPRPVTDQGALRYGKALKWYLCVRPGMTGLWQVSGRNDVDFRRRVVLDVCYVRAQSFRIDLIILIRTIRVVLGRSGY